MTTNDTSRLVRWSVIIVLSAATAGMIAVSLRANYLFGYGFGQTPEKAQVFGWANVAGDLWKVSGLILITNLWRTDRKRLAVTLLPIWVLCLLWGLTGAIGVYAQDRTTLIGGRQVKAATLSEAEHEFQEIEAKLRAVRTERTVAQVDAAIAVVLARPVMAGSRMRGTVGRVSANCTKYEWATAEACLEVARLREERAAAEERARLQLRENELRQLMTTLRQSGGALPADPLAELFAWLSRGQLNVRDIALGFPLVFALLIEFVSAFGPMGIVAFAEATRRSEQESPSRRAMAGSAELEPSKASPAAHGRVVQWMAERTEPTASTAAIGVEALHADYEVWCLRKGLEAASLEAFHQEFDRVREVPELCGKIRKFGRRYYGIRLVGSNVARLASRREV
jgi:hypothetical protein